MIGYGAYHTYHTLWESDTIIRAYLRLLTQGIIPSQVSSLKYLNSYLLAEKQTASDNGYPTSLWHVTHSPTHPLTHPDCFLEKNEP